MMEMSWLLTAFLMGLLGGTHCVGMCGGLSSAFTYALPERARVGVALVGWQLLYNSGRLLTYLLLGLFAGFLFSDLQDLGGIGTAIRWLAGLFMMLLGAYLAGWFQALATLEKLGGPLWRWMAPLRQRMLPIQHPGQAVAAGMLWGFLPCGLVYSAMALAITRAEPIQSAWVMLAFGLGTLPTLLATGTASAQLRRVLQRPGTRQTAGALVILFGLWTIIGPELMRHHHTGHASSSQPAAVNHAEMSPNSMDHSDMDHSMHH